MRRVAAQPDVNLEGSGVRHQRAEHGHEGGWAPVPKNRSLVAAIVLLAVAIGVIAAASPSPGIEAIAYAIAFGLFGVWAVWSEKRRWGDVGVVSPLSLYAIFWFLFYGIYGLGSFNQPNIERLIGSQRELLIADGLALISLMLIAGAYVITTRSHHPEAMTTSVSRRQGYVQAWAVYVCLAAGWAATVLGYAQGRIGYITAGVTYSGLSQNILHAAIGLVSLGLVALAYIAWSDDPVSSMTKRHAKALLLANVPLLVLAALASGLKAQLLTELMPVAVMYVVLRKRFPWRAVGLIFLYVVITYSGVQQFRTQVQIGQITSSSSGGITGLARSVVSNTITSRTTAHPGTAVRNVWDHLTHEENGAQVDLASMIYQTPRNVPYVSPDRFLSGPLFFLPTSWIPDGTFNAVRYVSVTYGGSTANSGSIDPQPGDFYMSGGIPAVIVGEITIGIILGFLWRSVMLSDVAGRRLILYGVIAGNLANGGLDWVGLTRFMLQAVVVYGPITFVLVRTGKSVRGLSAQEGSVTIHRAA